MVLFCEGHEKNKTHREAGLLCLCQVLLSGIAEGNPITLKSHFVVVLRENQKLVINSEKMVLGNHEKLLCSVYRIIIIIDVFQYIF